MLSEAPPSRELVTISRTWRELVEVKTLTNSGISAPASVPQVMTMASFHHNDVVAAEVGDQQAADDVGERDGEDRGEPDQRGERRFEVHLDGVAVSALWRWRR